VFFPVRTEFTFSRGLTGFRHLGEQTRTAADPTEDIDVDVAQRTERGFLARTGRTLIGRAFVIAETRLLVTGTVIARTVVTERRTTVRRAEAAVIAPLIAVTETGTVIAAFFTRTIVVAKTRTIAETVAARTVIITETRSVTTGTIIVTEARSVTAGTVIGTETGIVIRRLAERGATFAVLMITGKTAVLSAPIERA
jgi:hypothetical protein